MSISIVFIQHRYLLLLFSVAKRLKFPTNQRIILNILRSLSRSRGDFLGLPITRTILSGLFIRYMPRTIAAYNSYRALCLHHNVVKAVAAAGHPLPQTLDMEVIRNGQLPTHVIALSPIQVSAAGQGSYPLMLPIVAEIWGRKLTTPLPVAPSGPTQPAPRWDATQQRLRQLITLPVIPLEVPHPETVPILLLFALGLEPLPNMLASCLLPADAVGEFPAAYEMSNVMAKNHSIVEIISYVEQNRHIWENALNLGVKDEKIISIVGKAWKVTARARDKLYV
jgi:hypothetical protein